MNQKNIATELSSVQSGFLDADLFNQVARLGVLTYYELVALRRTDSNEVEVLLTKREDNDLFWANMWHNPGTVLRPTDTNNSFQDPLDRLMKDEYNIKQISSGPYLQGFYLFDVERGTNFGLVSWFELNESTVGTYFNVNSLPVNIIKGQDVYIKKCAESFLAYKSNKYSPIETSSLMISL